MSKDIIIMPSVGKRPWARKCFLTFRLYAEKCGVESFMYTRFPDAIDFPLGDLPNSPGRKNKHAYALKSYVAWEYLSKGYDRVLVCDDTCLFHPAAPNIFAIVPPGSMAFTRTGSSHAKESFTFIRNFVAKGGGIDVHYDASGYCNSGVVLYDKNSIHAFSPQEIVSNKDLLFSKFPHQTLLYYLVAKHNLSFHVLDKKFNKMPGAQMGLSEASRRNIVQSELYKNQIFYICHVSGAYNHRARLIGKLSDWFLDSWRENSSCEAHITNRVQ
jgi:hypothetical protein